jgi:hypothetical protein
MPHALNKFTGKYDYFPTPSAGAGTVTSVSVTTANGVSGSVATATTTPAITLTLGAITPSSVAATGDVTGANLEIADWNTAYGWGNHASAGYALSSALSSYVPTTRTLTINGTAYDLSANRSWTLAAGGWTDGTTLVYPTSATANVAIGGTTSSAPFYCTAAGLLTLKNTAARQLDISGYCTLRGADTNSGELRLGTNYAGTIIQNDGTGAHSYFDNTWAGGLGSNIYFRFRTAGTPVNTLILKDSGDATLLGVLTCSGVTGLTSTLTITDADSRQFVAKGYSTIRGADAGSGEIQIGSDYVPLRIQVDGLAGHAYIDHVYNGAGSYVYHRFKTAGTPVNTMRLSAADALFGVPVQASGYKSSDGTAGASATTGGLTFKDGLYTSGSATGSAVPSFLFYQVFS